MDRLFKTYGRLLAETDLSFTRYLYEKKGIFAIGTGGSVAGALIGNHS